MHRDLLKSASIYHAIYTSFFYYSCFPFIWICTIVDHWNKATNTWWISSHEITVTLADIQDISGSPILGIPPYHKLFLVSCSWSARERGFYILFKPPSCLNSLSETSIRKRRSSCICRETVTLHTLSKSFFLTRNIFITIYSLN